MPCGHGRTNNDVYNGANGRRHSLSKRSVDHSNYKYPVKESEVSALILKNSDGRCFYFTLVTFGVDGPLNFLAPFFLPVQGSDKTYNLESGAQPDAGSLECSSPPPVVSFHTCLQKEQTMSECKGSVQSLLDQNLRTKTLGESGKRNKRTKSVRNSSSNTLGNCLSPENSSGAFCDSASAVCLDVLLPDVSKVSKPAKKNSRKKGKKKGKHSKQYIHRKASTHVEPRCAEDVCAASVSEASGCSSHLSETNLSENSFSSGLSIEDINMEKGDGEENNIDLRNSLATAVEGRTCGTEIKDCEAPLLVRSDDEDFSCTQSSTDEDYILMRSSVTGSPETPLSLYDENTSKGRLKGKSSYGGASSTSMDRHIAPVTDVSLDSWKSGISENRIDDIEVQTSVNCEHTINSSAGNLVSDSRINGSLFQNLNEALCKMNTDGSNDILDVRSGSKRAQCSSEACHNNGFLPVVYGKRGRSARKMDKKLNGVSEFGGSNIHGWSGKDSNHRVWQKVQKNDAKSLLMKSNRFSSSVNFALKRSETKGLLDTPLASEQNNVQKASLSTGSDEMSVQSYLMKAASNVGSSDHSSKSTSEGFVVVTKRKPASVSKQTNHSPRAGSNTFRTSMARHSVIHMQQKERLDSPIQVNQIKPMNTELVSPGNTEIQCLFATPPDELECHPSEQLPKNQTLMDKAKYAEDVTRLLYQNDEKDSSLDEDVQISQLPKMGDALHVPQSDHDNSFANMRGNVPDANSVISDSKSEKCAKSEMGYCHGEYIKKSSSIGPLSQKCAPLGSNDSVVCKDNHDNILVSSYTDSTLAESSLQGLNQIIEDADSALTEVDDCTSNFTCLAHVDGEFAGVSAVADQLVTHEVLDKCISEIRTDLNLIVKAVNDSYKLRMASENIQLVYGTPIAEFERFLHFASPVLTHTDYVRSRKVCPQGQPACEVLCAHQTPCISLGSLWQWYEKSGSYGLEVKVGAYNNLKRCQSHYGFRAYFVPYLSAVQLFGRGGSSLYRSNESLKVTETCGMHQSTCPSLGSLHIFSKLLPRPPKVADTFMSGLASSSKVELCNQTAKSSHFSDGELIFEYFESDQPQQRRPLNEKIKELVRGNKSSNCQIFGDPANLEHRNLDELHPASWYSVAWYPIYRIPDGNLRAAFLTYHSLGHFTHRNTSLKTSGGATSLVSPVVGLQSYNTKGECWFKPKQFKQQIVQTEGVEISDPSFILKERLRTLEQTASVMARASVQKDGRRSANSQPDYEFFVSRKW